MRPLSHRSNAAAAPISSPPAKAGTGANSGEIMASVPLQRRSRYFTYDCTSGACRNLMAELHLPKPRMIDVAVPANQLLGIPHAV